MTKQFFQLVFVSTFLCPMVPAAIIYNVSVNTTSISGTAGSLDFNFNPGPLTTQSASLQILNFATDGSPMNCATNAQGFCPTGDVSGTLPATVTFDNGSGFNDYFDGFTFGSTLSFQVILLGPAISSSDGVSTSGSALAFSMFSDSAGTIPILTTDTADGFAFTVNVDLNGMTTITNYSTQTVLRQQSSAVPEPGTWELMALAVCSFCCWFRERRRGSCRDRDCSANVVLGATSFTLGKSYQQGISAGSFATDSSPWLCSDCRMY